MRVNLVNLVFYTFKYNLGGYKWQPYEQMYKRVINISNGFLNNGVNSENKIVIFAETRMEWIVCALACFRISAQGKC